MVHEQKPKDPEFAVVRELMRTKEEEAQNNDQAGAPALERLQKGRHKQQVEVVAVAVRPYCRDYPSGTGKPEDSQSGARQPNRH